MQEFFEHPRYIVHLRLYLFSHINYNDLSFTTYIHLSWTHYLSTPSSHTLFQIYCNNLSYTRTIFLSQDYYYILHLCISNTYIISILTETTQAYISHTLKFATHIPSSCIFHKRESWLWGPLMILLQLSQDPEALSTI